MKWEKTRCFEICFIVFWGSVKDGQTKLWTWLYLTKTNLKNHLLKNVLTLYTHTFLFVVLCFVFSFIILLLGYHLQLLGLPMSVSGLLVFFLCSSQSWSSFLTWCCFYMISSLLYCIFLLVCRQFIVGLPGLLCSPAKSPWVSSWLTPPVFPHFQWYFGFANKHFTPVDHCIVSQLCGFHSAPLPNLIKWTNQLWMVRQTQTSSSLLFRKLWAIILL